MSTYFFYDKLSDCISKNETNLCVGLDPDITRFPKEFDSIKDVAERTVLFCKSIIDLTRNSCAAYKPNLAFFEALGEPAFEVLHELVRYIGADKIIIADAKRGDIGNTAAMYKRAFFDKMECDAITVSPWMGLDTITPYLEMPEKGVYALVLTSNPGANDFMLTRTESGKTLSMLLTEKLATLQKTSQSSIGMVLGATRPEAFEEIPALFPESPLLIPGFGAQGGQIEAIKSALIHRPNNVLLNVTRDIMYHFDANSDWRERVQVSAQTYKTMLKL
jgi:orotidine-5'-phosphate decarboxylase